MWRAGRACDGGVCAAGTRRGGWDAAPGWPASTCKRWCAVVHANGPPQLPPPPVAHEKSPQLAHTVRRAWETSRLPSPPAGHGSTPASPVVGRAWPATPQLGLRWGCASDRGRPGERRRITSGLESAGRAWGPLRVHREGACCAVRACPSVCMVCRTW